jgi:hypothetical protein
LFNLYLSFVKNHFSLSNDPSIPFDSWPIASFQIIPKKNSYEQFQTLQGDLVFAKQALLLKK